MGDHRISIKMEVKFHGVEETADWWLNWSDYSSECHGVDQRVIDFFRDIHERGMEKYNDMIYESQKESRERLQRDTELKELARLKDKYERTDAASSEGEKK